MAEALSRSHGEASGSLSRFPLAVEFRKHLHCVLGKHGVAEAKAVEVRFIGPHAVQNGFLQSGHEAMHLLGLLKHAHGEVEGKFAKTLTVEIAVGFTVQLNQFRRRKNSLPFGLAILRKFRDASVSAVRSEKVPAARLVDDWRTQPVGTSGHEISTEPSGNRMTASSGGKVDGDMKVTLAEPVNPLAVIVYVPGASFELSDNNSVYEPDSWST